MKWSYEEEVLLVNLFFYTRNHSLSQNEQAIAKLSAYLFDHAKNAGYSVDEKFRNITGIKMKLQNLEYIASKGRQGLSSHSAMDQAVYQQAADNYLTFKEEVARIEEEWHMCETGPQELPEVIAKDSETTKDIEKGSLRTKDSTFNERPLSELFDVEADEYCAIGLEEINLTARALNKFRSEGAKSIADILRMTPAQIANFKGIGKSTIDDILAKVERVCKQYNPPLFDAGVQDQPRVDTQIIRQHIEDICAGTFPWDEYLLNPNIGERDKAAIIQYKAGYDALGSGLVCASVYTPEHITPIVESFLEFQKTVGIQEIWRNELKELLSKIPEARRCQKCIPYFLAFSRSQEELENLKRFIDPEDTLSSLPRSHVLSSQNDFKLVSKFLKWATFDLDAELGTLIDTLFEVPRTRKILSMRSQGKTLAATGDALHLTRERVRQLEAKIRKLFLHQDSRNKYLLKISAIRNGDDVLTADELHEYFGEYYQEFIYLYRGIDSQIYFYDDQYDAFVIGDSSLEARIQEYVESLPDAFNVKDLSKYINSASDDYDLPSEIVAATIEDMYHKTSDTYHRSRLSLKSIYSSILEKYFPSGLHVYDHEEINRVRELVHQDFGDIKLPENDRAITARLCDVGILCGRGMYRPKQAQYISKELANNIQTYIDQSDSDIFLISTLFSVFENDLAEFGVDNRYYLQGILKELFSTKYFFRRDYLSKDDSVTSIYSSVVGFIRQSQYPVGKEEIRNAFPGITDIVVNIATSDDEVLNFFGEYFHASHLQINSQERLYLKECLSKLTEDGEPHHVKDIYPHILSDRPELLGRNSIRWSFSLFSVLSYLFDGEFTFERPYIAKKNVRIAHPGERMRTFVCSSDRVLLDDLLNIAKDTYHTVPSILDLLNSFDDTHLIADSNSLISIDSVGISAEDVPPIEAAILSEIHDCTPIPSLHCIQSFKNTHVKWTEWLLYSVLRKWSNKLDVAVTSSQFKLAMPLVAPKGGLTPEVIKQFENTEKEEIVYADDLSKIDDLIADAIAEEIEGGDPLWDLNS